MIFQNSPVRGIWKEKSILERIFWSQYRDKFERRIRGGLRPSIEKRIIERKIETVTTISKHFSFRKTF